MTTAQAIGEAVHSRIWRKKISQRALATELGITQSTLSRKLHGERPWTLDEVIIASRFLGVAPSTLLADVNGYACSAKAPKKGKALANRKGTRSNAVAA